MEFLQSVVAKNLNTDESSIPGKKPFYMYFKEFSMFSDLDTSMRNFGAYAGFFWTCLAFLVFSYNILMCLIGLNQLPNNVSKIEKLHFIASPSNYLLRRDNDAIALTPGQREKFETLLR